MKDLLQMHALGDPGEVIQQFPKYHLQLLCCRFWWLSRWEFRELSFPYWRIYYNTKKGAKVYFNGDRYELDPAKIYLIAPNTSYSTQLFNHQVPSAGFSIKGGRIGFEENDAPLNDVIEHLFIHFNLGMPFDTVLPGIFIFDITDNLKHKVEEIMAYLKFNSADFDFTTFLNIQSLIVDLLSAVTSKTWDISLYDHRILSVLHYIESNLRDDLSNRELANVANLAVNSFTRLFTTEIKVTPQQYVKKKRIDLACIQLHHSNYSIDQIALNCGFTNRYHFTRIFSRITGLSPSRYRKEFGMK